MQRLDLVPLEAIQAQYLMLTHMGRPLRLLWVVKRRHTMLVVVIRKAAMLLLLVPHLPRMEVQVQVVPHLTHHINHSRLTIQDMHRRMHLLLDRLHLEVVFLTRAHLHSPVGRLVVRQASPEQRPRSLVVSVAMGLRHILAVHRRSQMRHLHFLERLVGMDLRQVHRHLVSQVAPLRLVPVDSEAHRHSLARQGTINHRMEVVGGKLEQHGILIVGSDLN